MIGNFSKRAKLWSESNPKVLVSYRSICEPSPFFLFQCDKELYTVDGVQLLNVLQDWESKQVTPKGETCQKCWFRDKERGESPCSECFCGTGRDSDVVLYTWDGR